MRRRPQRGVPVGLYATLLVALVCVALPSVPRRVESWLHGVQCVPLRAWGRHAGALPTDVVAEVVRRSQRLAQRERDAALAGAHLLQGSGLRGALCTVVAREERGAARMPTRLVLDRSAAALRDCVGFVTHGDRLLGFLDRETVRDDGRAAVALLHASRPQQRVPAQVTVGGDETLRFLIEPAGAIDAWPLRCRYIEDPYLASQVHTTGLPVRVAALDDDAPDCAPAGLLIGRLRVWGYRRGESTIPVGLFVEPALDPRAISRVVVWSPSRAPRLDAHEPAVQREPIGLLRLPAPPPDRTRWFLSPAATRTLPLDAPLLGGARLLGTVRQAGEGYALAAPFGERGLTWSLLLVPSDPSLPLRYVAARCVRREAGVVELRRVGGGPRLVAGRLFTGSNGPHCPPGLEIGPARPAANDPDALFVATAALDAGRLSVQTGTEVPR